MSEYLADPAPLLDPDQANRADVLGTIAVMILGRPCSVLDVEVRIRERRPDGVEQDVVVSGPVS